MREFEAVTPVNHERQRGENFCPFCDYWHPVGSIVIDHVQRWHAPLIAGGPARIRTEIERQELRAEAINRRSAIRERKAARDAKRGASHV